VVRSSEEIFAIVIRRTERSASRGVALLALALAGCWSGTPRVTVRLIEGKPQESSYVSPGAYRRYLEGEISLLRGDTLGAVQSFESALVYDPDSPYLHTRLAEIHARAGRSAEAQRHLTRALQLDPGFPDALLLQAKEQWKAGDPTRAEATLQQCLASNPDLPAAYLLYAELLEDTGRAAAARQRLEQLVARAPGDAAGESTLAMLCLRRMDTGCAVRRFARALQSRTDLQTLLRLAHLHRAEGRLPEAIKLLREAFDRSGGNLSIAGSLIEVLEQAGHAQAIDDLLAIIEADTDESAEHVVEIVELCVEAGRPARGLVLAEAQVKTAPGPPLQLARAEALAKLGRAAEAKELLRKLLGGSTTGATAAMRLARLLQREASHAEAADVLRQALTRHGHSDPLVLALSAALHRAGRSDPSVQVVRDALAGHPDSRALRFGLGAALERVGRWRDGVTVMRQLLQRHPKDAPAHNFIGYTLAEHGLELPQAERSIRRALYLSSGEGYIIDSLGWLYFRQGRLLEARRVLSMAVRLAPREAEVLGHLAEATAASKDLVGALQLLRRALTLSEDPQLTARMKKRLLELEKSRVGTR
jgi:tetratricopeptide (TPR) repeat protein